MADYMMNRGYFKPSLKQRIKNFLFPDYIMQYIISMRKVAYYQQNGGGGNFYWQSIKYDIVDWE